MSALLVIAASVRALAGAWKGIDSKCRAAVRRRTVARIERVGDVPGQTRYAQPLAAMNDGDRER